MRATTRSFSAEVKVTPFSSANGSFIDWIVSSGVIACPSIASSRPFARWPASINRHPDV